MARYYTGSHSLSKDMPLLSENESSILCRYLQHKTKLNEDTVNCMIQNIEHLLLGLALTRDKREQEAEFEYSESLRNARELVEIVQAEKKRKRAALGAYDSLDQVRMRRLSRRWLHFWRGDRYHRTPHHFS